MRRPRRPSQRVEDADSPINRDASRLAKPLNRLGFESGKPKAVPHGASVVAQEDFVKAYETLMNGLRPDETVLFVDAVHPEYQSRPARGWLRRAKLWRWRGPLVAKG